ncbi:hypothetical protein LZ198_00520 [Myxococcus sp. K15C18031901]|uniref:hypothetical protein n=1 Tax=Myxococcus dinghuensis TaxID=2906761 RepID=UPI0020A80885|nr:hypothetical protein [Myxococcus dinghuensis]MCP3097348.1 hypothetical protein [Myxococcus dinghuensis]
MAAAKKTKPKNARSSKQAKQKLTQLMETMEKTTLPQSTKGRATCSRAIYCV